MKKGLIEIIEGLNLTSMNNFCEAISKAQNNKIEMGKELILARYGDEDWIRAIRKKDWNSITKMYNRTKFSTMVKFINLIGEKKEWRK